MEPMHKNNRLSNWILDYWVLNPCRISLVSPFLDSLELPAKMSVSHVAFDLLVARLLEQKSYWHPRKKRVIGWAFFEPVQGQEKLNDNIQIQCILCKSLRRNLGNLLYKSRNGPSALTNHASKQHPKEFAVLQPHYQDDRDDDDDAGQPKRLRRTGPRQAQVDELFARSPAGRSVSRTELQNATKLYIRNNILCHAKAYEPLSSIENKWHQVIIKCLKPDLKLPSRRDMRDIHVPALVNETKERFVLPAIDKALCGAVTYDLWMQHGTVDEFAVNFHFVDISALEDVCLRKVNLGLVKISNETGSSAGRYLGANFMELINQYPGLAEKIVGDTSDGGGNLIVMRKDVDELVKFNLLPSLPRRFIGPCFGHVWSGAIAGATKDQHVTGTLPATSTVKNQCPLDKRTPLISLAQMYADVRPCTTWPRKSTLGRVEWNKSCLKHGLSPRIPPAPVPVRMASRVQYFAELLKYRAVVDDVYKNSPDPKLAKRAISDANWSIIQAVVDATLQPVKLCFKNQSFGHWFISDAIVSSVTCYTDCVERIGKIAARQSQYVPNTLAYQVCQLELNMTTKIGNHIRKTLKFLSTTTAPEHDHNMFALMLDPRYKSLWPIMAYFEGSDETVMSNFISVYDERLLDLMVDLYRQVQGSDLKRSAAAANSSDASQQAAADKKHWFVPSTQDSIEPEDIRALMRSQLQAFRKEPLAKKGTNPLHWWADHRTIYPVLWKLIQVVFCMPGSQIDIERIFSIAGHLTANRRANMGAELLAQLIYINQNWPNDPLHDLDVLLDIDVPQNQNIFEMNAQLEEEEDALYELLNGEDLVQSFI